MRVYISGQITGLPFEEVERNFNEAEQRLEAEGFTAVNPLNNGLTVDHKWIEHMKADIKMLLECDAIYLLKSWRQSKGATIERDLAVSLGYKVIEQIWQKL